MRVDSRRFGCWSNTREQCSRESDARVDTVFGLFVTSSQYPWSGHFYLRLNKSDHSTCGWTLGAPVGISLRGLGLGPEFRLRGPRRLAWELNPEVLAPIAGTDEPRYR